MAYDEIQNLILNVQGREEVENLKKAIIAEEEALKLAVAAHGQQSAAARQSADTILTLNDRLIQTQRLVQTHTVNVRGYAQASQAAGYAIQDFASANGGLAQQLQSVSNNIPQILSGIGGPGVSIGLVAGVSAFVAVAAASYGPISRMIERMDVFGTKANEVKGVVEKLQARIKELEDMKIRPTVDTMELDNLRHKLREIQTATQAFEQFRGTRGEAQQRAGEETEQIIAMAPGGARDLADRLAKSVAEQKIALDAKLQDIAAQKADREARAADLRQAAASAMAAGTPGAAGQFKEQAIAAEKEVKALEEAKRAREYAIRGDAARGVFGEAHQAVGAMFKGATLGTDPGARENLVRQLQKIGEQQLAAEIAATNVRAMAAAKDEEDADEAVKTKQEDHRFRQQLHKKIRQNAEKEAEQAVRDAAAIDEYNLKASKEADLQRKQHEAKFKQARPALKSVAEQVAAENASIKASGAEVMAERLLAGARVARAGGEQGFKGKTDDQLFDMVQREVQKYLHRPIGMDQFGRPVRANRGMGGEETSDMATRITAGAQTQLQKDMTGLSGKNLNDTGRLIQITAQLTATIRQQQIQAQQHDAAIDQLQRGAMQLGQTRLNRRGK